MHAVDLTADEPVRTTGHGGDDEAVGAPGHGIGAEQHAAPGRLEERLHEHGDRSIAAGADDLVDGVEERSQPRTSSTDVNSPAIDCEPPSSTVDDERTTSGSRPVSDSAAHASCSATAWTRVPAVGDERRVASRRQDEAGQHRDAGGAGPGQRGRLGAGDVGTAAHSASRSTTGGSWSTWTAAADSGPGWIMGAPTFRRRSRSWR